MITDRQLEQIENQIGPYPFDFKNEFDHQLELYRQKETPAKASGGISSSTRNSAATGEKQLTQLHTLPGYINMGNTCFANSVLQCLCHIQILMEYCS